MSTELDYQPHHPTFRKKQVDLHKVIRLKINRNTKYSKDDIIRAARLYLVLGNQKAVAREIGCDHSTIRAWMNKDWWPILIEEVRYLKNIELDSTYTHVMEKALSAVLDRLENGDEVVVNKEIKRKKISARDAALISAIMFDKRQLLRGDPTQIQQQNFNVDERLSNLMDSFEKIAQRANEKVIEGEVQKDVREIRNVVNLPFQREALESCSEQSE